MEITDLVAAARAQIVAGDLKAIDYQAYGLRNRARDLVARVFMGITQETLDAEGSVDWTKVKPSGDLDAPLTHDEVARFVASGPPDSAVSRFCRLFDPEDDSWPVTPDDLLKILLELAPARIGYWFNAARRPSARFAALLARYAEPLGDALGASGSDSSSLLSDLPPLGQARYIERLAASDRQIPTHTLRSLSRAAAHAPEAFTVVAERVLKGLNQREAGSFQIDPGHLDAGQLSRLLACVRTKDKLFARVSLLLAIWGTASCAAALAGFLGDAKRGRRCARWLAAMGALGRQAARDALAAAPPKKASKKAKEAAALAKELADKVLALPETPPFLDALLAGCFVWSLDVKTFLIEDPPPAQTAAAHPPISLEAATRALAGEPVAEGELGPHHWADLLQIVTLHPQNRDVAWAYERAEKKGLLGRGTDAGTLIEAIGRFNFDFFVKDHFKSPLGLFNFLIGAGAPREILLHAMAVYVQSGGRTLGQVGRHFERPLGELKPPGYAEMLVLARHIELMGVHGRAADEASRWPVLLRAEDLPLDEPWTSPEPLTSFRLRARVRGASRITVKLRKRVTLTVDVGGARWHQDGLSGKKTEGPTAPPGDPALIELEVYRNALRFGVGGASVGDGPDGYLFEGVGKDPGPIVIAAEGEGAGGARLVEVLLTENRSMRDADDIADLLGDEDAKKVNNVAGTDSEFGALALAAEVSLGENEQTRAAAQKALRGLGARGKPWADALGLTAAAAPAKKARGAIRSFEEVLADFVAGQKKQKPLQRANLRDGVVAASFGNPESPKWRSGHAVSEDTVYLLPPDHLYGRDALDGPEETISALTGLPTVTTWNTRGDGAWVGKRNEWIIVESEDLVQEQDEGYDSMSLAAAAWKVQEGVALAIFREGGDLLAQLMDLPDGWPKRQDWESMEIWIGE